MGAAAGPIIGAVIGAYGSYTQGKAGEKAADRFADTAHNAVIPSDIRGFRAGLERQLNQLSIGKKGFLNPSENPIMNEVQNNLLYFSSPEFFREQTARYDPDTLIQEQIQSALPGFRSNLQDILGGINSSFSAQGNRYSSDLNRQQSQVGADSISEFERSFAALKPQLIGQQLQAQSLIPQLISGQTGTFNTLMGPDYAVLNAMLGFGTAGVGGAGPSNPYLASSGSGDALSSLGNAIPGIFAAYQNANAGGLNPSFGEGSNVTGPIPS